MKKFKKCLMCCFLSLTLVFSLTGGISISANDEKALMKISDALKERIADSKTVQIAVCMKDTIEKESVQAQVFEEMKADEKERNIILGEASAERIDTVDNARLDSYIKRKTDIYSSLYQQNNSKMVNKYFKDEKLLFMSVLSPIVVLEVEASKVKEIAEHEEVFFLDLYQSNFIDSLNVSLPLIESDVVNNTYGYTGAGVKIGQVEKGVPNSSVSNVVVRKGDVSQDGHATKVARIISSVAPDAKIYSASVNASYTLTDVSGSVTGLMAAVEWLITTHNVNIINCSGGIDNYVYDAYCFWAEHIAINHNVHFVQASGNFGANKVHSPALAYNVITVGNLNDNNSTVQANHTLSTQTAYAISQGNVAYKPDLCAPGANISYNGVNMGDGSSLSAPHVTGAIALMCEQKNTLKVQQRAVKAILAATTNYDYYHYSPKDWAANSPNNYSRFGAGVLNSKNAYTTILYSRYYNGAFTQSQVSSGTVQTYTINVTSGMTRIRVALAALCTVTGYSHYTTSTSVQVPSIPDLNIKVYYGNTLVGSSTCEKGNIEIVDFKPRNYGTGTYTIKVIPQASTATSNTTYYTVAWW